MWQTNCLTHRMERLPCQACRREGINQLGLCGFLIFVMIIVVLTIALLLPDKATTSGQAAMRESWMNTALAASMTFGSGRYSSS